jgi:hypothetical protein
VGKFPNIFESATKFSKFENLPVAHGLYDENLKNNSPATTPPVGRLFSLLENKRK